MVVEFTVGESGKVPEKKIERVLVEVTQLPSNFLSYPKGSKIFYTPFTLGELETLNSGTVNFGQALINLIDAITTEGFDKDDLAYFDLIYIGIKRKLTALGDIRGELTGYCPKCGQENSKEFTYTEIDFTQPKAPGLPAKLSAGNIELHFSLFTYRKWVEFSKRESSNRLDALAYMVTNHPYEKAKELINQLTGEDIICLDEIEVALDYGIKPMVLKCSGILEPGEPEIAIEGEREEVLPTICGNTFNVEVTNPFDFTFRTCRCVVDTKSKIRFGGE